MPFLRRLAAVLVALTVCTAAALCAEPAAQAATRPHQTTETKAGANEWHVPRQPCPPDYWKSHRVGPLPRCGWHTTWLLVRRIFTRGWATADCIVRHESGYRARAHNPSGASGLFQFMPPWWWHRWNPFNPVVNALHGWSGSRYGTSWGPWSGAGYWCPGM